MLPSSPLSIRYHRRLSYSNSPVHASVSTPHCQSFVLDRMSPKCNGLNSYHTECLDENKFIFEGNKDTNTFSTIHRKIDRSSLRMSASERKQKKRNLEFTNHYGGRLHFCETNNDVTCLNERLRKKTSQHTYDTLLQCELLNSKATRNSYREFELDDLDDSVSNSNSDDETSTTSPSFQYLQSDIAMIPCLPNHRSSENIQLPEDTKKRHHPLCPYFDMNHSKKLKKRNDMLVPAMKRCECHNITGNVAGNFIHSPQRALAYSEQANLLSTISCSPISSKSQSSLCGRQKTIRNICKLPYKILDAPKLIDDFYLNLVDWSESCNVLSVGLADCVYLWNPCTSKVNKVCDLSSFSADDTNDIVCSVAFSKLDHNDKRFDMDHIGIGTNLGFLLIYDLMKCKPVSVESLEKHGHRVGVIAWRDKNIVATGSRDRYIWVRDIRIAQNGSGDKISCLNFHKQEVCGLKWSDASSCYYLASGGNDNRLAIWDIRKQDKALLIGKHRAAVKAISWSPHQSGTLATGGGTADRCIKIWNINKQTYDNEADSQMMEPIKTIDTGSQVCNLLWNKNVNEIVSTHGYSLNQIVVWKYPSMDKLVTLTGHTLRVLYLAASPDGQNIVTGAADQTLRLWNVFPSSCSQNEAGTDSILRLRSSVAINGAHIR